LADLSQRIEGPFASESLIRRALLPLKKSKRELFSVSRIAEEFSPEDFSCLQVSTSLADVSDICPLFTALSSRATIGVSSWKDSFEKLTGLKAKSELTLAQFAYQAMRERFVTNTLGRL
jgi:hypothetical protein